jgi:predicted nucleotidyltransferase
MKIFGLQKEEIDLIKKKIEKIFPVDTDLKVFLFGSRARGTHKRYSDLDLAFKSKDKDLDSKLYQLKEELEESSIPLKIDLVNWDNIIQDYLPQIKKQKIPFWDKSEVKVKSAWRICPLGQHWVSPHLKSGNIDPTDGHCRDNPSKKDLIKIDEIKLLPSLDVFKKTQVQAALKKLKFNGKEDKYDLWINGWCAYWNDILKPSTKLHPNYVKALIATESSFEENPERSKVHTAIGLMQIMPKTIGLANNPKELKDHLIELKKEDVFDPNVNICLGVRWLFRKYEILSKKNPQTTWEHALEEYKGIRKQKGPESDKIRSKIAEYLDQLGK